MPLPFKFIWLFNKQNYLPTLLVLALPLAVYWQVWDFALLWDDAGHLQNFYINKPTLDNFYRLFSQPFFGMYIPISYLFWGWLKMLAGFLAVPTAYVLHTANAAIHLANGLLVLVLLRQFVGNKYAALVAALLFSWHPIQVETVAWMSEFRGVLAAFFALLSLYWYMRCPKISRSFCASLLFFLLALLCKPSAAVLPVFIVLINHFHYQFTSKNNLAKSAPFLLLTLGTAVLASQIQYYSALEVVWWQRPFIWADSIVIYLTKIVLPTNLSASYSMPTDFFISQWWFYPLALLPLAVGLGWFFVWQKIRLATLAMLLFIAGFLPTSGLVSFTFQTYSVIADRYLYLAFFGVALGVGAVLDGTNKRFVWILAVVILAIFGANSAFRQLPIWQTPAALWAHSRQFEAVPSYAAYNHGKTLVHAGELAAALKTFNLVLSHYPKNRPYQAKHYDLFYNRGVIFYQQQQPQKALDDFTQALKINPNKLEAQRAKIYTHLQLNQCNKAQKTAQNSPVKIPPALQNQLNKICG